MKTKKTKQQPKQLNQPHAKTRSSPDINSKSATLSDHIRELRRRILWVAIAFFVASSAAYNYHDQLVQLVMAPLHGEKLIYLTPGGGFSFIFQITLYAGLVLAAPMLMYQLYGFVRPTLPSHVHVSTLKVAGLATLLMLIGVGYGYFIAVPAALHFLSTFAGSSVLPSLTADSYLSFFLSYVAGLALLFQLPLLLIFWHWIHPMKPGGLLKSERFIVLFAFIVAALITPTPDVFNQSMIAVPLIALYQIGVVTVLISIARQRRKTQKAMPEVAPAILPAETPQASEALPQPAPVMSKRPTPIVAYKSIDGFRIASPSHMVRPAVQPSRAHATIQPIAQSLHPTTQRQRSMLRRIDGISAI